MTNRREPAFDWVDIIAQHNSIEFIDEFGDDGDCMHMECIPDTLDWYTTSDLVALATQIDAELQRRADIERGTQQGFYQDSDEALWEGEGGSRKGYSDGND